MSRRRCPCVCLLLALLALPLACTGGQEPRRLLARIDGVGLFTDEFRRQWVPNRLDADDLGVPPSQTLTLEKRALLSDLIGRRLLRAEAERVGVVVGSDEVEAALQRAIHGWSEGLVVELRRRDLTLLELKNELRDMLVVRRYLRDQVLARVAVTDAEIEAYAAQHPEALQLPETVHLRQIVVASEDRAKALRRELGAKLSFEDAALKNSLGPAARIGGDLGLVRRGSLPQQFEDVCFALSPGQVSEPLPSAYGVHLFKMLDRQPPRLQSLTEVRATLELHLRREREREATGAKLRELWDSHRVEIKEDRLALVL